MNLKYLNIIFIVGILIFNSCEKEKIAVTAEKGYLNLQNYNFFENGTVKLDGEWEFYWNKLLSSEDFKSKTIKPDTFINVPSVWKKLKIGKENLPRKGYATYRLKVDLQDSLFINFKFYRIESSYNVWVNGELILKVGNVSINEEDEIPIRKTLIANYQNKTKELEIIIQVSNYHHNKCGIINSVIIGPPEILYHSDKNKSIYNAFLIGFLLIIAFTNMGLFILRKTDKSPLFFSLACLFTTLNLLVNGEVFLTFFFPDIKWEWILKYDYWTNYLKVLFFYLFITYSFKQIANKTIIYTIVFSLLISTLIIIFFKSIFYTQTLFVFYIIILAAFLHLIYLLIKAARLKISGAIYSIIGTLVVFITAINDILFDAMVINTMYLTPFGLFIFVFLHSYIISLRFTKALEKSENLTTELKKFNENLENIVDNRTLEISQQKEEIQTQAEILAKVNSELEKLSIVASKTDNSIVIMDEFGNLEWVNEGSRKLYGYDLNELIKEKGKNILEISNVIDIDKIMEGCRNEKKSYIFETQNTTRWGNQIWVQTTLSPIIDEANKVIKIIAIDADITKLKEAEQHILKQNHLLEIQHNNITASITYAETIQKSILPPENLFNNFFEKFVIYKAKDVVSGDFFMMELIQSIDIKKVPDRIYAAVVDCTGHGVPGAFMSLITNRILLEIINKQQFIYPAQILCKLGEAVHKALYHEYTENSDGLDICICMFEKNENNFSDEFYFAGAKRPLYKFNNQTNVVEVYNGDKTSIGGIHNHNKTYSFENQKVKFERNDIIYLTSDGYIDQADDSRKKFGTIKLLEILKSIGVKPMQEQKLILENELIEHQSKQLQRDDITIFAIKLI